MKKLILIIPIIASLASLAIASAVQAVCPVCTVAVVGGVGLSRWLGIDDSIAGLWIGGLTVSMIMWTIDWMDRKNYKFKGRKIIITIGYYLLIVVPLFFTNIMGHPLNKIWGIDKLLLGIILGSILFFGGAMLYSYLKKKNGDKAHFPYQKVVMPIAPLIIFSIIFYFLTR
ncbi:MAG: hypothetical protein WC244_04870 [Patescibacteria group bacterium]|jgi:hypothetical protein